MPSGDCGGEDRGKSGEEVGDVGGCGVGDEPGDAFCVECYGSGEVEGEEEVGEAEVGEEFEAWAGIIRRGLDVGD